jgi:hypothetical protein
MENSLMAEKNIVFLPRSTDRHPLSSTKSSDFNIYNGEPTEPSLEPDFWGRFSGKPSQAWLEISRAFPSQLRDTQLG